MCICSLSCYTGTTISCTLPMSGCVEEGSTVTVVCTRDLDRTVQSRIMITSQDGTATCQHYVYGLVYK